MLSFGKQIKNLREQQGLTQIELAEKAKLNVRTIQRIENDNVIPRKSTLVLLFKTLGEDFTFFQRKKPSFYQRALTIGKHVILNLFIVAIIAFCTIDSWAGFNSRFAGIVLSILIPILITLFTPLWKPIERLLVYGIGLFSYFILVYLIGGVQIVLQSWLFSCLVCYLAVLGLAHFKITPLRKFFILR